MSYSKAKEKAQAFKGANEGYFSDAIKRHGIAGNSADLKSKYDAATKGLDPELAFKALDGGRVFGESGVGDCSSTLYGDGSGASKLMPGLLL